MHGVTWCIQSILWLVHADITTCTYGHVLAPRAKVLLVSGVKTMTLVGISALWRKLSCVFARTWTSVNILITLQQLSNQSVNDGRFSNFALATIKKHIEMCHWQKPITTYVGKRLPIYGRRSSKSFLQKLLNIGVIYAWRTAETCR